MSDEKLNIMKEGNQTSEYKVTKWTVILSLLAIICGLVTHNLPGFMESNPEGFVAQYGGLILSIAGVLGAVLAALGYGGGRVKQKVASIQTVIEQLKLQQLIAAKTPVTPVVSAKPPETPKPPADGGG